MFHVKHWAPVEPRAAPAKQPHASKIRPMISMPGGAHPGALFACVMAYSRRFGRARDPRCARMPPVPNIVAGEPHTRRTDPAPSGREETAASFRHRGAKVADVFTV